MVMKKVDKYWTSYFDEPSLGVFESDTYFAASFKDGEYTRLDIHRKDWKDGITWDELQKIKSECGFGGKEAFEVYPKDSDVLNTANFRHLYIVSGEIPCIRRIQKG